MTAFDQQKNQATQSYKMTISPALVITTVSPLTTGVAGGGQLQITIQAQGGTQPYTFSVVGTLPPGLTLTQNGLLVGNPTASGTFNFGVTVTDAQQVQVTKQFQITFTPAPSLLQVSSTQLNFSALLGGDAPAPQTLVVTSSSVAPVNFSVQLDSGTTGSAVPRWVTVQASQGVTPSGIVVVVDQSSSGDRHGRRPNSDHYSRRRNAGAGGGRHSSGYSRRCSGSGSLSQFAAVPGAGGGARGAVASAAGAQHRAAADPSIFEPTWQRTAPGSPA